MFLSPNNVLGFLASYRGLAILAKPRIHSLQKPAVLKNSLTCPWLWWLGILMSFFSCCGKPSLAFFQNITKIGGLRLSKLWGFFVLLVFCKCLIPHDHRVCGKFCVLFLKTLFSYNREIIYIFEKAYILVVTSILTQVLLQRSIKDGGSVLISLIQAGPSELFIGASFWIMLFKGRLLLTFGGQGEAKKKHPLDQDQNTISSLVAMSSAMYRD